MAQVVKSTTCQCRRQRRCGSSPSVEMMLWGRKWQPIPVVLLGKSRGQRSLVGYSPWACRESGMTEHLMDGWMDKSDSYSLLGTSNVPGAAVSSLMIIFNLHKSPLFHSSLPLTDKQIKSGTLEKTTQDHLRWVFRSNHIFQLRTSIFYPNPWNLAHTDYHVYLMKLV